MKPYTHCTWIVKQGREDEFVRLWQQLADWTITENFAQSAMLLHDVDEPLRFVSLGPWHTVEEIERWRSTEGFAERVERLHAVLDRFEPTTLELVFEAS